MNRNAGSLKKAVMVVLFLLCCMLPAVAGGQQETPVVESSAVPTLKGEPEMTTATIETITATVEIDNDGGVLLVENAGSKSRSTYTVIGDMAHVLYNFRDEVISVDVVFLEKKRWSGSLVVVSLCFPDNE